jgi:hypothetical protein
METMGTRASSSSSAGHGMATRGPQGDKGRCVRGLGYLVSRVRRATIEVRGKTPLSAISWTP